MGTDAYDTNEAAYRRLRGEIDSTYRPGEYVAIVRGKIVAHAETFESLLAQLDQIEEEPMQRFVVQAGVNYPDYVVIRAALPGRKLC